MRALKTRRSRRGLSPLIAAVVLISATIVGGMLVYQYFQNTMNKAQTMAEGIAVTASTLPLSSNTTLVHITVMNNYNQPVTIESASGILANASTIALTPASGQKLPVTIPAGGKTTLIFVVNNTVPAAVVVHYEVNGQTYQSDPVQVK